VEVRASGLTDVGFKRERNEDAFSMDSSLKLYLVADGMGGHLAGEVASKIAVELIGNSYRAWTEAKAPSSELFGPPDESLSLRGNYVLGSIRLANRVIHELAAGNDRYQGMGTTIALLAVLPGMVIAANVGDSRIYMIRNGEIGRLSKDHTIVAEQVERGIMSPEEAEVSPMKHILTRNLGSSERVEVEVYEVEPSDNDRYLLCSDGVTDLMADNEILEMALKFEDPQQVCQEFVSEALKRGGHDNTTVISVFLSGSGRAAPGVLSKTGLLLADFLIITQKWFRRLKP
jgi:protein phosphatase